MPKRKPSPVGGTFAEWFCQQLRDPEMAGGMLQEFLQHDKRADTKQEHQQLLRQFLRDVWAVHGPNGPGPRKYPAPRKKKGKR